MTAGRTFEVARHALQLLHCYIVSPTPTSFG